MKSLDPNPTGYGERIAYLYKETFPRRRNVGRQKYHA